MHLLDTSVLLLWLAGDERLPMHIRSMLNDATHPVYVSAVSIWEIAIKSSIGKLNIADSFLERISESQLIELPISFAHARKVSDLPNFHRDPFDRLLIAQAIIEKLTLITNDKIILRYPLSTLGI